MKRIIACLMAGVMLLALVGCGGSGSSGSASSAAKKDYTQILHDARSDEDNTFIARTINMTTPALRWEPPSTTT